MYHSSSFHWLQKPTLICTTQYWATAVSVLGLLLKEMKGEHFQGLDQRDVAELITLLKG